MKDNLNHGWISIHRTIKYWGWFKNPNMTLFFIYLLIEANHKDNEWQGLLIKRGQLVFGRKKASEETGINENSIRTCLKRLTASGEITVKSTNKYSIITILNYDDYQQDSDEGHQQSTSKPPTKHQQSTTNNNVKNVKNETKYKKDTGIKKIDFFARITKEFSESYFASREMDYIISNKGKESAAISKLVTHYKSKNPDSNTEKSIQDFRDFFDRCMGITDPWIYDNMSIPLIFSQLNKIQVILKNGNKRRQNPDGATYEDIARIIAEKFAGEK